MVACPSVSATLGGMKLDIFCELQSARSSEETDARALFSNVIEQAKLADQMGFHCWWMVEHHTTPEFSFSSAPDTMLAVIAQHTERIRLGTSGILSPFEINHPVRVAERSALVDVLSNGRLDLGLARSGLGEWETFGVDAEVTKAQLSEALHAIPRIWTETRFKWDSELLQVPERDFVPKPLQKPHPPLWQTVSSPEGCESAGELGVGLIGTCLFTPPERIRNLLEHYRKGLARSQPAGQFVNDQAGFFTVVHCAETRQEAIDSRAAEATLWFMNVAPLVLRVSRENWVNIMRGEMGTGVTSTAPLVIPEPPPTEAELNDPVHGIRLMNRLRAGQEIDPEEAYEALAGYDSIVIGDVDTCRTKLRKLADLGIDRVMCLKQIGGIAHDDVMRSLRVTGEHLIPEFSD